ncbi:zinc finger protein 585B [Anabrus simplex]|uniref:zinc finger protein 585B n=1 Tax=Anabrus simplex TaxID=316456 RepID=UPI0035A2C3E8
MEDPHFIKCEPDWLSVTESSPNLNTDEELLPVSVEKIKVEPDLSFTDLSAEEHTLGIVKEELDIQDVKEEFSPELDGTGGPCVKEMNPVLLSPVAEVAVVNSVEFTERMKANEKCLEVFPQIRDATDVCHVPFNSLLPVHEETIIEKNAEKGPSCDGCGKTLIGPGYGGPPSRKKLFCMTCIDMYSQSSDDSEQPYVQSNSHVCSTCGEVFNARRTLVNHILNHKSRKMYDCEACGKSFTRKCTLKIHSRIHTGEKCHVCTECGKAFARLVELRTHMLIHEQSLPYKCSICGTAFRLRARLYKHILVHTETSGLH